MVREYDFSRSLSCGGRTVERSAYRPDKSISACFTVQPHCRLWIVLRSSPERIASPERGYNARFESHLRVVPTDAPLLG